MKLNISFKFDIYTLLMMVVLAILIGLTWRSISLLALKQLEYNQLVENNKAYTFDYSCDNFDSKYFNCPTNESIRNITGTFCQGKMICQNSVRKNER